MKRGESGVSLLLAVDKPAGKSSHDVVNAVRRIFGEKRVGHMGTLDPLASGVLPLAVGPAARLNAFLTEHDKRYRVKVAFGVQTDTDDAEGSPLHIGSVPDELLEEEFARIFLAGTLGKAKQLPPVYSAIKVGGTKACDAARRGKVIDLAPRDIEVFEARLVSIESGQGSTPVLWTIDYAVSKGTYIRSLARDLGVALGTYAHVAELRRLEVGTITLEDCIALDALEETGLRAALDPVKLLGYRFVFLDDAMREDVACGRTLSARNLQLCAYPSVSTAQMACACMSGVMRSTDPLLPDELVCMVDGNRLQAIYYYDESRKGIRPRCVFQTGVLRGYGL